MSSGVSVNEECMSKYTEFRVRKSFNYIIYKLSENDTEIEIEKAVKNDTYQDFLDKLPENEPRYAVYDFSYGLPGEGTRYKLVFYLWIPESSSIRQKMVYASSKLSLRKKLMGVTLEVQGTDASEVTYETVLEKVLRIKW